MARKKGNLKFGNEYNMGLLTDLYQLTMAASYFEHGKNEIATFDMFVRKLPKNRNYLVAVGLEQVLEYLENLHFGEEDIAYLKKQGIFKDEFLEYLKEFRFTGDVYAVKEGTIIFANEPILRITAPRIEAQIVETYILNQINFQTMIASKASRIVHAAKKAAVVDFSPRRDHGSDAALKAARASYIAGCVGTSNVLAGKIYEIPIIGTMAHSYIMSFDDELEAFRTYAKTFPENTVLLIDTYNTIEGAKKAVIIAKEMGAKGYKLKGVRLDSGDLVELSKKVRRILDKEGLDYVKIVASSDLNEYKIAELIEKGAKIDIYGVGTEMGTSKDAPAISGVYKLCEDTNKEGKLVAKIKLSEGKITLPGRKQVYRISNKNGEYKKDIIALEEEILDGEPLLEKVMENGRRLQEKEKITEIRKRTLENLARLPKKYKSINNYEAYPVEISTKLKILIEDLIKKYGGGK